MKILIVDNGTKHLRMLKKLLINIPFEIINYSDINIVQSQKFDAVILSGGHNFPVFGNEHLLQDELNFVKKSKSKIFGICFGFQLIASAFGAELKLLQKKEHGIIDIQITSPDKIFLNIPNFRVFEGHRWVVKI